MNFLCATYFADHSLSILFGAYMCVENVVMLGLVMILSCECKLFKVEATVWGWSGCQALHHQKMLPKFVKVGRVNPTPHPPRQV